MNNSSITSKQIHLLNNIKNFYNKNKINNIDNYKNSFSFFSSYDQASNGYSLLKYYISKKNIFFLLKNFIRNFLLSFYTRDLDVKKNKQNFDYNKIIISWSNYDNFNKNGSYNDKYFNVNSRIKKKTLWFLIHLDQKIPKKIDNNIIILFQKNNRIQFIKFFKFIFNLSYIFVNFKKMICEQSNLVVTGKEFANIFLKCLNQNVKKILTPYEGQPFQSIIIKETQDYNKNIKILGYIQSFPPAFPSNLFFRQGCPDKLIVNGYDQKYCLTKFLNWKKQNVIISYSTRFINEKKDMSNYIFLPINFSSSNFIINQLRIIVKKKLFNNNCTVKNHPQSIRSKKHINLIKKINLLKKENYKNINLNNSLEKQSIFIGATSSVIEALERGTDVVHIVKEPIIESYNSTLWPNIKVYRLSEFIYKYSLKESGKLLKFGYKNKTFNKYLSF
jgi:hypothetical protein